MLGDAARVTCVLIGLMSAGPGRAAPPAPAGDDDAQSLRHGWTAEIRRLQPELRACRPLHDQEEGESGRFAECLCSKICDAKVGAQVGESQLTHPISSRESLRIIIGPEGHVLSCGTPRRPATHACEATAHGVDPKAEGRAAALGHRRSSVVLGGAAVSAPPQRHWHWHGGQGAQLNRAELVAHVPPGDVPWTMTVGGAWLLHKACREAVWDEAKPLVVRGVRIEGEDAVQQHLSVPSGRSNIRVEFKPVEAYNACDGYAVRLLLQSGTDRKTVDVPLRIGRLELEPGEPGVE